MGRKLCVNGARTIVKLLEQLDITCILISDIAAYLLGGAFKPKDVKVVIIPSYVGNLPTEQIAILLAEHDPVKLHIRHEKNGNFLLSYHERPKQKTKSCPVQLVSICNPPPPEYMAKYVIRVDGLPVGSMLPLVIERLRTLPFIYPPKGRAPSKLPKQFSYINWMHGHESLREAALQCLNQMLLIFPTLKPQLSAMIHECQAASALALLPPKSSPLMKSPSIAGPARSQQNIDAKLFDAIDDRIADGAPKILGDLHMALTRQNNPASLRIGVLCIIAKTVVDVIRGTGAECALFGSLACHLYGNTRSPNDIDLIASSHSGKPMDAERLKQLIVERDSVHFCLGAPKDPTATYRILYFIVDQGLAPANTFHKDRCKIDVLVPGLLHLPSLTGNNVKWRGGLPVVPFPVLLLQKLQGWDDHMHMSEPYKFIKHETDASDVQALLKLEHVVSLRFSQPWEDRTLFTQEFMDLSKRRIADFCHHYPESAAEWYCIGFDL